MAAAPNLTDDDKAALIKLLRAASGDRHSAQMRSALAMLSSRPSVKRQASKGLLSQSLQSHALLLRSAEHIND